MTTSNKLYGTVLIKAKDILDFMAQSSTPPTLKNLSENLNISKPTILKILTTLEYCGYVTRDNIDKHYYLGIKFLGYASNISDNFNISNLAKPYLTKLKDETKETINLGILDDKEVVLLNKLESPNSIKLVSRIGGTMPLYSSAMGKAILSSYSTDKLNSYLSTTDLTPLTEKTITDPLLLKENLALCTKQGYAVEIGENQKDVVCVGFLLCKNNHIFGAFSISAPEYRVNNEKLKEFITNGKITQRQILSVL